MKQRLTAMVMRIALISPLSRATGSTKKFWKDGKAMIQPLVVKVVTKAYSRKRLVRPIVGGRDGMGRMFGG